jgi:catechol 2,3-dioxygenase-like lactoylglutathione lyase family enzyme
MITIDSVILEVPDLAAARAFYDEAFGPGSGASPSTSQPPGPALGLRAAEEPASGFRSFTLSLVVSQPATVDSFLGSALAAGATELKPAKRNIWGYGGVVRAPDGAIWKVATSAKRNRGPAGREFDNFTLLLGVADVAASKAFYAERGVAVARSFGRKFVQFDTGLAVTLALYGRSALAKDAGVDPVPTGSPRLAIAGDAGAFTDPDGFAWEAAPVAAAR